MAEPADRDTGGQGEPDPSIVWRWVAQATQPLIGWILVAIGLAALILGWLGASRVVLPAQQIPYLVSGGLGGVALIFLGGVLLGIQDMRRAVDRIGRLERQVGELHGALLSRQDAPDVRRASGRDRAGRVAVLPSGSTFHRQDCAIVADKDGVTTISVEDAQGRELSACKLCEPLGETEPATAG